LKKRLSGNTEFIAAKYIEKASLSVDETGNEPRSPEPAQVKSPIPRMEDPKTETVKQASRYFEHQSEIAHAQRIQENKELLALEEVSARLAKTKLADRWPFKEDKVDVNPPATQRQLSSGVVAARSAPSQATPTPGKSKLADRWPHTEQSSSQPKRPLTNGSGVHSRDSSLDQSSPHSRHSSVSCFTRHCGFFNKEKHFQFYA